MRSDSDSDIELPDDDDYEDDDYEDDEDDDYEQPSNRLKWALIAVTVLAIVATILLGVTLFGGGDAAKDPSAQSTKPGAGQTADASANDTGPVAVITEDPSCAAWTTINNSLSNNGAGIWNERDRTIPADQWNQKQRFQFMAAGTVDAQRRRPGGRVGQVDTPPRDARTLRTVHRLRAHLRRARPQIRSAG